MVSLIIQNPARTRLSVAHQTSGLTIRSRSTSHTEPDVSHVTDRFRWSRRDKYIGKMERWLFPRFTKRLSRWILRSPTELDLLRKTSAETLLSVTAKLPVSVVEKDEIMQSFSVWLRGQSAGRLASAKAKLGKSEVSASCKITATSLDISRTNLNSLPTDNISSFVIWNPPQINW